MHGRELLASAGRWNIGLGQQVSIIDDLWLGSGKKASMLPGATASRVADQMGLGKSWDNNLLRLNLIPASVIEALRPLPRGFQMMTLYWPLSKDGKYIVKSGCRYLLGLNASPNSNPSSSNNLPNELWNSILV